jgi:hypothetical protein
VTVLLTPTPRQLFLNPSTGLPYVGGLVFQYAAGTTTKIDTYTDSTGDTPNTNPIVLDALGEADIWLTPSIGYKFVFAPSTDTDPPTDPIWTVDNIFGSPLTGQVAPWAIATGSADAITATYSPPNTSLPDGLLLGFRASAPNLTTTPTFAPDGQAPYVIVQRGGAPVGANAIAAQNAECLVRFNKANSYWEFLNPNLTNTSTPQASIVSATTTDIGSTSSTNVLITGTTTITGLGSSASLTNPLYNVEFNGSLTLTYNASSLILPGSQNIITQNGDCGLFEYRGSGNWQCLQLLRANGQSLSMAGGTKSIASATTTNIGSTASNSVLITGTTTITGFGSSASLANPIYFLRFNGALTLTYNSSSLILPGAANITTAAGDTATAEYLGSGNWQVLSYNPANGYSVVGGVLQSGVASSPVSGVQIDFNAAVLACSVVKISFYNISLSNNNVVLGGKVRVAGSDISSGYNWVLNTTYTSSGPTGSSNTSDNSFHIAAAAASYSTSGFSYIELVLWPNAGGVGTAQFMGTLFQESAGNTMWVSGSMFVGSLGAAPTGITLLPSAGTIELAYKITGY